MLAIFIINEQTNKSISEEKNIDNQQNNSQSVFTREILPGVNLTSINTNKFKSGCLTINFIAKLSPDTAATYALLPRVLRRGSKNFPGLKQISAALDELYGARIEPLVRKKGEVHCVGLYADYPDDRFIPGEQELLEQTLSLVGQLLLSPNMQDGLLLEEYISSEKANLIDDIRAAINDKRSYAVDRLLEEMCPNESYSIGRLGTEKQADTITPESLTQAYHHLLNQCRVEIFYCGSAEHERVSVAVQSALSGLSGRTSLIPKTEIILSPAKSTPGRFTESLDVSQGKLAIGFRLGAAMENPDYPALIVFNSIYGGSITSKLFLNVRERLSLCYYASSTLDKHKGIMLVSSGVDFSNFEIAIDEIIAQLELIKSGQISDWELISAKKYVITSIKSALDRLGGLEEFYFDSSISAVSYNPMEVCEKIEHITHEQITKIASEALPDMIYILNNDKTPAAN